MLPQRIAPSYIRVVCALQPLSFLLYIDLRLKLYQDGGGVTPSQDATDGVLEYSGRSKVGERGALRVIGCREEESPHPARYDSLISSV